MTNCLSEVGNFFDERERAALPAALISLSRTDAFRRSLNEQKALNGKVVEAIPMQT
jgi:hypothetical protein